MAYHCLDNRHGVNWSEWMMRTFLWFVLVFALYGVAACGVVFNPGSAPVRLQLRPTLALTDVPPKLVPPKQLVVARPLVDAALETDAVTLLFHGRELRYLAGYRWENTNSRIIQMALIDGLSQSGCFQGVGDETSGLLGDGRILLDIRQFALRYASENAEPSAEFLGQAQMMDTSSGRVVSTITLQASVPALGKDALSLAAASEEALKQVVVKTVRWAVQAAAQTGS